MRNKIKNLFFILLFIFICTVPNNSTGKMISLDDLTGNLRFDDYFQKFSNGIRKFAESSCQELFIPPGIYFFKPHQASSEHVSLKNLIDKKIIAAGVTFVFTDLSKTGIKIVGCANLQVYGLTCLWKKNPYLIGRVKEYSKLKNRAYIQILNQGYDLNYFKNVPILWASVYSEDMQRDYRFGRDVLGVKSTGEDEHGFYINLLKRKLLPPFENKKVLLIGKKKDVHCIKISDSKNIKIDTISLKNSPGMGIVSHPFVENISIENTQITHHGLLNNTLNADGIHLINPIGKILIVNNVISGLQDDAIVISVRGLYAEKKDNGLNLINNNKRVGMENADDFLVLKKNGEIIKLDKPQIDNNFILIDSSSELNSDDISSGEKVIVFPIKNLKTSVDIFNNSISNIRGIGIRINAEHVNVQNNIIANTSGPAVRMSLIAISRFHPQFIGSDVNIKENVFYQPSFSNIREDFGGIVETRCISDTFCSDKLFHDINVTNNTFIGGTGFFSNKIQLAPGF